MGSLALGGDGCARCQAHQVVFLPQGLLKDAHEHNTLFLGRMARRCCLGADIHLFAENLSTLMARISSVVCIHCGASIIERWKRARHGPFQKQGFGADVPSLGALAAASFSDCSQIMAAGRELQWP